MDRRLVRISKYMSYLLRHNPGELKLDSQGYASLEDLLRVLREKFPNLSLEEVISIVERSPKKRFELKGNKIRAIYGHSKSLDLTPESLGYEKYIPKGFLYHGTTPEALGKILKEGLKAMDRLMVHLSLTPEDAREVALRRTRSPVILQIDAPRAHEDGIEFFKAGQVILCRYLPPRYIREIYKSNS